MKANIGKFPKTGKRRIDIKIDNFDTWSFDHTISLIVLPALIQLKETMHGIPNDFNYDDSADYHTQHVFDFMKEDADKVFDMGCEKWRETLDKMIWSFLQIGLEDDYDSKYHHGLMDISWEKTDNTYLNPVTGKSEPAYSAVDKNPGGYWYDVIGHRLHEQRIQEGLDLFAKYFRSLWD